MSASGARKVLLSGLEWSTDEGFGCEEVSAFVCQMIESHDCASRQVLAHTVTVKFDYRSYFIRLTARLPLIIQIPSGWLSPVVMLLVLSFEGIPSWLWGFFINCLILLLCPKDQEEGILNPSTFLSRSPTPKPSGRTNASKPRSCECRRYKSKEHVCMHGIWINKISANSSPITSSSHKVSSP